jgi:DNA repair protein RadC
MDPTVEGRRYTIKQLPPELRPRERLLEAGPGALSNAELLGILFGIGNRDKTAVELASEVISTHGDLFGLHKVTVHDLIQTRGVGQAKACIILAAVEFGKRLGRVRNPGRAVISSPADVESLLRGRIANLDRENFVAVLLNTKNEVLECPTISVGTLSSSLVHPREVFKPAIRASAAGIILAHNHPSGKVEPSREDRDVTRRLVGAAEIIGIEVLDHVILGDGYFSMKEHGML